MLGVPKDAYFTGVVMDVDQIHNNVEEKKNCYEGWVAFNRASGMRSSAYEHQIPEQLFSTDTEQAEGVSTAKALALAMAQGQRIYTLTSDNASELNNISIDEGARAEIQQALVQGMEVTVHQAPINVNGWEGSGYSVLDPDLGVGAYQISGGASGGFANIIVASIITIFGFLSAPILFAIFLPGTVGAGAIALAVVALINFFAWTNSMRNSTSYNQFNTNNLAAVLGFVGGTALLRLSSGLGFIPLIIFFEGIMLAMGVL